MSSDGIMFTVFVLIIIVFAWVVIYKNCRKEYYDIVSSMLSDLAGKVFINDRETLFDYVRFTNTCKSNGTPQSDYKKNMTSMVKGSQKRKNISDDAASKVLDIVYKRW